MPKAFVLLAAAALPVWLVAPASAGAAEPVASDRTILLADASGLNVRLKASEAVHPSRTGNLLGAAINTAGVARATIALVVDGRVYLAAETSRPSVNASVGEVAAITPRTPEAQAGL